MRFFFSPSPGPSTSIDTACSSSLLALENAFHAIRNGQCDAALVGGVNLLLKPNTSVQFMKLGMLSPEGTCKSFDSSGKLCCEALLWQSGSRLICILHVNSLLSLLFFLSFLCHFRPSSKKLFLLPGNGYCRSEAAVVALLTKRSFAKRVYATVVNAGNNTDGFKEQGKLFHFLL